eukprot:m.53457 g.53457  ORF g.53457 m.53457 type:complete len:659 (+) comp34253_c0_seq8:92-2068(+)
MTSFPKMDLITQKILARTAHRRSQTSARKRAMASKRDGDNLNLTVEQTVGTFDPKRRRLDSHEEYKPTTRSPTKWTNTLKQEVDHPVTSASSTGTEPEGRPPKCENLVTSESVRVKKAPMEDETNKAESVSPVDVTDEGHLHYSPARKELSEALSRQHIDSSAVETNEGLWALLDRFLAPEPDAEITVFRNSLSPWIDEALTEGPPSLQNVTATGKATSRSSLSSVGSGGSVVSLEGGSQRETKLRKSYSVTMMLQNSAMRASYQNDAITLLLKEASIQEDIERQAGQALSLCSDKGGTVGEEMEGERLLRIAAERRAACLEKVRELRINKKIDDVFETSSCLADIVLSEISFPLDPEFVSSLGQKNDRRCFSYFCLIRLDDTSIAGTHLLSTNQKNFKRDLHFTNKIVLHGAGPRFKIWLEVYGIQTRLSHQEYKQSFVSAGKKPKLQSLLSSTRHNSPFSKLAPGRKLQALFSQSRRRQSRLAGKGSHSVFSETKSEQRTSRFVRLGRVQLNAANCKMTTFQLQELSDNALLGPLHVKVQIDLESMTVYNGFLTCHDGLLWNRLWAQIDNGVIRFWKYPDEAKQQSCLKSFSLFEFVGGSITNASIEESVRPNVLMLTDAKSSQKKLMAADSKEERTAWCEAIQDVLNGLFAWKDF